MIKRLSKKSGQMEISFGMIFSIILIIIFLVFAFYAIRAFLNFQNDAKAGRFYDRIQEDINTIWRNQGAEQQDYVVPSYVDFVCFVDFSSNSVGENSDFYSELKKAYSGSENLAFYPVKFTGFESKNIDHIDTVETTSGNNPLCIKSNNGKVSLTLKKDFGEALVTIER